MRGRMRAAATCVVMLLLLEGLLVGIAEGYSVEGVLPYPVPQQTSQVVKKGSVEDSKESLEDNIDDDPDFVPNYDNVYYDDDSEYSEEKETDREEYDSGYSEENEIDSHEDGGYDDDHSQEDDSIEGNVDRHSDETVQTDSRPLPEVTVPQPGGVIAQYGYGKGGNFDDDGSHSLPVKSKRNVKQVVKESAPYGSEQDKIDSGLWGSIQDGSGGYPWVSTGVEPLFPVGGLQPHEVGAGVVPELEGAVGDKDKESSGSSVGGWFREGWRRFTGAVEDLGDKAEDTFRSLGKEVEHTAGRVHETVSSAVDKLHQKYDELRKRLPQILERFKALILKFGVVIQEGARYCLRRFEHSVDQVRESHVIVKLEQKLKEGHAEVATFFQILGEKVQAWREKHGSAHVDAGLLDGYTAGSGQTQQEGGVYRQDIEEMPDFFQDPQVIVQLDKLKEDGVLTDSDIIILTQEHVTQNQQN
ncbi:uncharacterized protein LOC127009639 isoform X2 [Eriocheir sinensis]|uniref:uncharacterized protein LOC127009639 isoform X2 n=1 Tax=Eriocheir sinensis TaxID=95602 RepID=UPI0021C56B38|nr:uncharacterized protein LOC127009639 isoform X2 [Eriocheir sinensis]